MALDSLLAAIAADGRAEIDRVRHDAERAAAERLQAARDTAAAAAQPTAMPAASETQHTRTPGGASTTT